MDIIFVKIDKSVKLVSPKFSKNRLKLIFILKN